jgi:hypothetical protein
MSGNRPRTALVLALTVTTGVTGCGAAQAHGAGTPAAGQPAKPGVTAAATPPAGNVTGRTTPAADRDRPADQAVRARAAGLDLLAAEDLTVQCHAHLDVIVDGRSVSVAAGLGTSVPDAAGRIPGTYEPGQPGIAALHTHDTSGVLHVESPTDPQFTLGQLFAEWNVAVAAGQLGGYHQDAGTSVRVFVDGQQLTTDPAGL